ncbi:MULTISPECIES: hypothetical protein [Rhodomicrobium]|uniref:hypothetical protein n=1 Tax=Rhodomicrobium TaxID=1068 RepID=UPI000F73E883|nr:MULTISPECIES: hypothetical protein [Rhodomicrobium]
MTLPLARPAGRIGATLCLLIISVSALSAEGVCVRCTGPDQTYRCDATADHPIANRELGLFCAAKIASERGHDICATQRNATDCDGVAVTYTYEEAPGIGLATLPADEPTGTTKRDEPATLGEFTKDAVSASAKSVKQTGENIGDAASKAGKATTDAIKGAGSAIGNATKKTWNCLGSALNDC